MEGMLSQTDDSLETVVATLTRLFLRVLLLSSLLLFFLNVIFRRLVLALGILLSYLNTFDFQLGPFLSTLMTFESELVSDKQLWIISDSLTGLHRHAQPEEDILLFEHLRSFNRLFRN